MNYRPFELEPSWQSVLQEELKEPYIAQIQSFVELERQKTVPVYPPKELVLNAFNRTPYDKVRVVIIGQDPYHGPGQAHGLSFSVPEGVPPPPSLVNIFKELGTDLGVPPPAHGCLLSWADQGVLLLNATLTVRQAEAKSHFGRGWERFTDAVVSAIAKRTDPVVFMLWGKSALDKCQNAIDANHNQRHLVLTAPHPSPLSAYTGFLGCRHFSTCNAFLTQQGLAPIDWAIPGNLQ